MAKILYLHDIQTSINAEAVAANRNNIDLIDSIETFLAQTSGQKILTIDDGYKSSKNIIPLIEKYETKCILFITTDFIDKTIYPYEIILSDFLSNQQSALDFDHRQHNFMSYEKKVAFFQQIHSALKPLSKTLRENRIKQLFSINKTNEENHQHNVFLDWADIVELDKHPLIEIGSHTKSHLYLPSQNLKTIFSELKQSKKKLELYLSRKVTKVSYPYGGASRSVILLSRLAGYHKGYCTSKCGGPKTNLNIPRLSLSDIHPGINK